MLFWAQVSAKSSCFRHAVTPSESGVALFHKWCDKRVTPTEKMSAHWPVNDGEDRSGTIPREGMARWTVVFAPISFAHYKPGIPNVSS